MTTDDLRRMASESPFLPFLVHLADGRSIKVTHPEQVATHPESDIALVKLPAHDFASIDVKLVTSLSTAIEPGNGA